MTEPLLTPGLHARQTPDAPAIVNGSTGVTVTFAQLEQDSAGLARALRSRGLTPGRHLAILMENTTEFLVVAWAAQRSGLYYTAINHHLRPDEVQYVLDDCGAEALVTSTAMTEVVTRLDLSRVPIRIAVGAGLSGFEPYLQVLRDDSPSLGDECEGREMLYSSGTTGRPKGIRRPLSGARLGDPSSEPVLVARGIGALGVRPGSVFLSPAPLYHAAPLVYSMSMLRLGATVVIMASFEPLQCLALVERHRVTHAQFVPTMFVRMLRLSPEEREQHDLSSLVFAVHAGAPCPVDVKRRMIEWWGPIIHEYYSGTEGVGNTYITCEEWLAHPGSVGRPSQECHIVGEDGRELPPRQPGLVYFAGGMAFEYHNDPSKTAGVSNERVWRTLGDIGFLDSDGYLYLTDRQAHTIISGGVNIYPQQAENVLAGHPAVADVAVIGVPDSEMGEAVKAVVQLMDGAFPSPELEAELLAHCRAALATYQSPRTVDFVEELPRDDNGKLYKRVLRERYWQGHESRVI
ncbi:MAG: acyl-CoA synthetase [Mycobacteriales bacterium]